MTVLLPALHAASGREAVRFGARTLSYAELAAAAGELASRISGARRVAVWATPSPETVVGVVAALLAGVAAVPLNPKTGERETAHIVSDSAPSAVLARAGEELPAGLAGIDRVDIPLSGPASGLPGEPSPTMQAELRARQYAALSQFALHERHELAAQLHRLAGIIAETLPGAARSAADEG